jgi:MoxR-like ATPase
VKPALTASEILRLQELVRGVPVADSVVKYAVSLVGASRPGYGAKGETIHRFLRYGGSTRAAQYLILGAKARAVLRGHFHVDFADVQAVAVPVLRHRLVLNFHARAEGVDADALIRRLIELVPAR